VPEPIFTCDVSNGEEPTSVHALTPGDIDVVAAVGDTITAGYGIDSVDVGEVEREYRGKVFSIGGDGELEGEDRVVTLANILEKFNPNLRGTSAGIAGKDDPEAGLNKADPESNESMDMLAQVQAVVATMESEAEYDYENDWKLLTMYVGFEDLCYSCEDEPGTEFTFHENIRAALDWLHTEKAVPRMLVNFVGVADVTQVQPYIEGDVCELLAALTCPCLVDQDYFDQLRPLQQEYNRLVREDILGGRYDTREDFTIVYQPFLQDNLVSEDETGVVHDFMAPDCMHPSTVSHQTFGLMLWHNMLSPVRGKTHFGNVIEDMDELVNVKCPTAENPYIFTNQNSQTAHINRQK
jgi:phospholipase B1